MADAIQMTALQMADIASGLQSLAFKHASGVSAVLQTALPLIRSVPIVGDTLANSDPVKQIEGLSVIIVDYTRETKSTIHAVEDALMRSDVTLLKSYSSRLEEFKTDLDNMLKS